MNLTRKDVTNTRTMIAYVIQHLEKQNIQANDSEGDCQYLSSEGLQCAVGCLVSKDNYDSRFESMPIEVSIERMLHSPDLDSTKRIIELQQAVSASLGGFNMTSKRISILQAMQECHDNAVHEEDFIIDVKANVVSRIGAGRLPKYTIELFSKIVI